MQSYPSLEKKYKTIQLVLLVNIALASLILNFIDASLFSYELQYYILIFFVAIIGLPHGFFDYMISQKLYGHIKHFQSGLSRGHNVGNTFYERIRALNRLLCSRSSQKKKIKTCNDLIFTFSLFPQ